MSQGLLNGARPKRWEKPQRLRRWEAEYEMVRAGGSQFESASFCVLGLDVFQGKRHVLD